MRCDEIQALLARRFDEGEDLAAGLQDHLTACAACRGYLADLRAVEAGLFDLPGAVPSPDLARTIRQHAVASEVAVAAMKGRALVGVAAVFVLAAAAIGWLFPLSLSPLTMWEYAAELPAALDVSQDMDYAFATVQYAADQVVTAVNETPALSSTLVWPSLALLVAFTLVYNGISARLARRSTANENHNGEGEYPFSPIH